MPFAGGGAGGGVIGLAIELPLAFAGAAARGCHLAVASRETGLDELADAVAKCGLIRSIVPVHEGEG